MSSETLQQKIRSLEFQLDRVKESAHLNDLHDRVARLDRDITGLKTRIAALRTRGYAFGKTLEERADAIQSKWKTAHENALRAITRTSSRLKARLPSLDNGFLRLKRPGARLADAERMAETLDDFEDEIKNAEESIEALFEAVEDLFSSLNSELGRIEWMLNHLDEASFSLLAGESGILACKAVWAQDGEEERKGDPQGILYLTDQRIIFEQKEKVATKKMLFIATEKKLVQELRFEAPVAEVEEMREFDKGMLGKDNYLDLQFSSQAPRRRMVFHVWASPSEWMQAIKRAQRKDFDADRAIEPDEEAVEKVRNAPSECPSCGATIGQTVLRGQDTLTCEYCGYVFRL